MNSISESVLRTSAILDGVKQRQQASQLILLAIVDKSPCSIKEVRQHLLSCLSQLKQTSNKDFYFDLGWLDTPESILNDFSSLNWVEGHHSIVTYRSTTIGKASLMEQWEQLQPYLGLSLSDFQRLCQ